MFYNKFLSSVFRPFFLSPLILSSPAFFSGALLPRLHNQLSLFLSFFFFRFLLSFSYFISLFLFFSSLLLPPLFFLPQLPCELYKQNTCSCSRSITHARIKTSFRCPYFLSPSCFFPALYFEISVIGFVERKYRKW